MRFLETPICVGRPDDPVPAPRYDEEHAPLGPHDDAAARMKSVPRNHQVDALRCPHMELSGSVGKRLRVVRPHASGVDHLTGAHGEPPPFLKVHQLSSCHTLTLPDEPGHTYPVGGQGA